MMLLSAMFLAGAGVSAARADGAKPSFSPRDPAADETAFAEARPSLGGDGVVGLPRPLGVIDANRYRLIFAAQRRGDLALARAQAALLTDRVLLGDVLAARYLSVFYPSSANELRGWLRAYPDAPDASAIHALLAKIAPGAAPAMSFTRPLAEEGGPANAPAPASDPLAPEPFTRAFPRNPLLDRTVSERAALGVKGAASARHLVDITPGMTASYAAQLYGEIALSLLSQGQPREALRLGCEGSERGGRQVGLPAYAAGLAAWREGQVEAAYYLFSAAANAPLTPAETRAAAAFWASRTQGRAHALERDSSWLERAAAHRGTFYGLLAERALALKSGGKRESGTPGGAVPGEAVLGEADVEAVSALPQGRQLFALLQVGERDRAEALLRRVWPDVAADGARARSVRLVAAAAGFDALSRQMAALLDARESDPGETLPMPRLRPAHGFRLNPALVYALARVESNFDSSAASEAGAYGLMQVRSLTASFVTAHRRSYDSHGVEVIPVPPDMAARLRDPASNLEIGQLYILYLARQTRDGSSGEGDLLRVLASYNAGPGAISKWDGKAADPLYFVETLPNPETRDYVRRALSYSWQYARRMRLSAPSLTALARAEWPSFTAERSLAVSRPVLN